MHLNNNNILGCISAQKNSYLTTREAPMDFMSTNDMIVQMLLKSISNPVNDPTGYMNVM